MYTNADSLHNKLSELKVLLDSLTKKPKIIAITEVKDKTNQDVKAQEFSIPGYLIYSNNLSDNSRGVIIYVDSALESSEISLTSNFKENVIIKVKGSDNLNLTVCTIYRSPNSSLENDYDLSKLLNDLCFTTKGHIIILGDFNLRDINWKDYTVPSNNNISCQILIDFIRDNHLIQFIDVPTRARGTDNPSILDLVITNNQFVEDVDFLAPLGKSDHAILNINCNFTIGNSDNKCKPNYSKGNYDDLRRSCNLDWYTILNPDINDVECMWTKFKDKILESSNLYIPLVSDFRSWKKSKWKRPISVDLR